MSTHTTPSEAKTTRAAKTLIMTAILIIMATWTILVIWQPQDSSWQSLADSRSSTVALIGFTTPAVMLLAATLPTLPAKTLALMPIALALNIIFGQIIGTMGLPIPLYIDSLGTVLIGALAGPAAGVTTGVVSALVWSVINPTIIPFAAAYAFVGFTAGLLRTLWARPWWTILLAAVGVGFITALLSAPVASFILGGTAGTGTGLLVSVYRSLGADPVAAVFLQSWTSDPLDKCIVFTIIWIVYRALPERTRRTFSTHA